MIRTATKALSELTNRGFPLIFERIYQRKIPIALVGTCEPVRRYFEIVAELANRFPPCVNYLPLWETNLEAVVALDMQSAMYVRYTYGSDICEILGKSYQQFVTAILIELVDSGIWDELDELSTLFGYRHTNELREFVSSAGDSDFEASKQNFVRSITD